MTRRIEDAKESVRLGTWNCLIRLVARDIDWARQLANEHWPSERDVQLKILQASVGFWGTSWSAAKFLELMPHYPMTQVRETFHLGTTTSYENNGYYRGRVAPPKGINLLPHQDAMVKVLDHIYHDDAEVELLGERFCGFSTLKAPEDPTFWFFQLGDLGDCQGTWRVYESAARFLRNPSKETLAQELRRVAPVISRELRGSSLRPQPHIPWPLAACINMCDGEIDALDMARKADAGQLGDRGDWFAAEHRWKTVGVTEHDIVSMSDDRLPFDGGIDTAGFPLSLSIWPGFPPHSDARGAEGKLFGLHGQMTKCRARTLVASLVEVCVIHASMYIGPDEVSYPISLDSTKLQSLFEDLPMGRSVPLHTVVNILSGDDEQISELFRTLRRQEVDFIVYQFPRFYLKRGLNRLKKAFLAASDKRVLVPVFGALAEHGQLPPNFVDVPSPEHFEDLEQKIASLVIMLAQESWDTDRTSFLIDTVKETAKQKAADEVHAQIINTLSENISSGTWFEKFLVEFEELLSTDSYHLRKSYALLLQDTLRRRTSRFANVATSGSFQLPRGITELL